MKLESNGSAGVGVHVAQCLIYLFEPHPPFDEEVLMSTILHSLGTRRIAALLALGLPTLLCAQEGGDKRRDRPMPRPSGQNAMGQPRGSRDPMGGASTGPTVRPRMRVTGPAATHRRLPEGTAIVTFSIIPACTVVPNLEFWFHRDLMTQIQLAARSGYIPVTAFPGDQTVLQHFSQAASGWRAYGFLVPPHGVLRVDLDHPKPAWFRVFWIDRWGSYRPGMKIKPGEPQALYENPTNTVQAVYAIADDPGHWSSETSPYTLKVSRSWKPEDFDPKGVTLQQGIWAFDPTFARIDVGRR